MTWLRKSSLPLPPAFRGVVCAATIVAAVCLAQGLRQLSASEPRMPRHLILFESEEGFKGTRDYSHLIGKTGVAHTVCRPSGKATFDDIILDVVSRGEFIDKGTPVEVFAVEGNRILVREVKK